MPSKKRMPQAKNSQWKNWGDYPPFVLASLIIGLGGLLVAAISLWYTLNDQSHQQATSTTIPTPLASTPYSPTQQTSQPKSNSLSSPASNSSKELPPQSEPVPSTSLSVDQQPVARQPVISQAPIKQPSRSRSVSSPQPIPSSSTTRGDDNVVLRGNGNAVGNGNVIDGTNRNNPPNLQPIPSSSAIEGSRNIVIEGNGNASGNGNRINMGN